MTEPTPDPDRIRGARPLPVQSGPGAVLVVAGDVRLVGWSLIESTGAAVAQVDLIDGQANGGTLVGLVSLAAGASETRSVTGHGVQVASQLVLLVNAGSIRGVVYVIDN